MIVLFIHRLHLSSWRRPPQQVVAVAVAVVVALVTAVAAAAVVAVLVRTHRVRVRHQLERAVRHQVALIPPLPPRHLPAALSSQVRRRPVTVVHHLHHPYRHHYHYHHRYHHCRR